MTNPISTSPKRPSQRREEQQEALLNNHPWGEVMRLPPAEVETAFRSETWKAISRALRLLQEAALAKLRDTRLPASARDEAAGEYNIIEDLQSLPELHEKWQRDYFRKKESK